MLISSMIIFTSNPSLLSCIKILCIYILSTSLWYCMFQNHCSQCGTYIYHSTHITETLVSIHLLNVLSYLDVESTHTEFPLKMVMIYGPCFWLDTKVSLPSPCFWFMPDVLVSYSSWMQINLGVIDCKSSVSFGFMGASVFFCIPHPHVLSWEGIPQTG